MPIDQPPVVPETIRVQRPDGQVVEMLMDEYLKGVIPAEMGLQKPIEALKAQAVASRSFATATRRHARAGFDVCSGTHCQVWKPEQRYPDADQAVDETSGVVALYNNQPIGGTFFAHCDGHTRNSEDVWTTAVPYLRGVACICGYTTLYGHGVGMCQRGAAAMAAQQGASFQDILAHYFTGIQVARVEIVPRSALRHSIIVGRVMDGRGGARGDQRLVLRGPAGAFEKGTTADGRYWFSGLPAGRWELTVKNRSIRYADLFTDGRSQINLDVAVPDVPALGIGTAPLAGARHLAGTLGYSGVPITVVDPAGHETTVLSGSAPTYDPGGFEIPLQAAGKHTLRFLDRSFDLDVGPGDAGLLVQFSTTT